MQQLFVSCQVRLLGFDPLHDYELNTLYRAVNTYTSETLMVYIVTKNHPVN